MTELNKEECYRRDRILVKLRKALDDMRHIDDTAEIMGISNRIYGFQQDIYKLCARAELRAGEEHRLANPIECPPELKGGIKQDG